MNKISLHFWMIQTMGKFPLFFLNPSLTDLFAMLLSLLCLGTNCDLGRGVLGLASDRGWGLRLASCLSSEDAGEAGEERPESEAEPEPWTWRIEPLKVKQTLRRQHATQVLISRSLWQQNISHVTNIQQIFCRSFIKKRSHT